MSEDGEQNNSFISITYYLFTLRNQGGVRGAQGWVRPLDDQQKRQDWTISDPPTPIQTACFLQGPSSERRPQTTYFDGCLEGLPTRPSFRNRRLLKGVRSGKSPRHPPRMGCLRSFFSFRSPQKGNRSWCFMPCAKVGSGEPKLPDIEACTSSRGSTPRASSCMSICPRASKFKGRGSRGTPRHPQIRTGREAERP